jgi:AhpD family alkylhydroperoxidase
VAVLGEAVVLAEPRVLPVELVRVDDQLRLPHEHRVLGLGVVRTGAREEAVEEDAELHRSNVPHYVRVVKTPPMARIELPDGPDSGEPVPEVTRALSLRPGFAQAVAAYEKAVGRSSLDWRLHELVRMRVAQINQCTVCLSWRNQQAVDAGVTEELLDGVDRAADLPGYTDAERVALEYTERFSTDSAGIDDDLLTRLGEHYDAGEIVELTLVIGKYVAMGRFMQVLGLDQTCDLAYDDAGSLIVR